MGGGEPRKDWKVLTAMLVTICGGLGFLIYLGFVMKASATKENQKLDDEFRTNMATATAVRQDQTHYYCRINTGSVLPQTFETIGLPVLEEGPTFAIRHGQPEVKGGRAPVSYEKEMRYIIRLANGQTLTGSENLVILCARTQQALSGR